MLNYMGNSMGGNTQSNNNNPLYNAMNGSYQQPTLSNNPAPTPSYADVLRDIAMRSIPNMAAQMPNTQSITPELAGMLAGAAMKAPMIGGDIKRYEHIEPMERKQYNKLLQ